MVEYDYAHWGETKETMRAKAIDLFTRLLSKAREIQSFPQDGSKGQAEAYHIGLLHSLDSSDAVEAVGMVLDAATEEGHELSDNEICDAIDWEQLRKVSNAYKGG
jgi:hypothetical protein